MKGKKVKYVGKNPFFDGVYDLIDTIHDSEPIGNGETNQSGADMYRCKSEDDINGQIWLFRKDEIEVLL